MQHYDWLDMLISEKSKETGGGDTGSAFKWPKNSCSACPFDLSKALVVIAAG